MGKVYLVGGGPGDPELLTLKAARILNNASVVLHDSLVSAEVLALVSAQAELINVGKRCGHKLLTQDEINSLLISLALSHKIVVRLKGGDPLIFGRAGEEIEALINSGTEFEIVPGITAAVGAAAGAKISLTDRRVASQVLFTTVQRGVGESTVDWGTLTGSTTLVIYMPQSDYAHVASLLRERGLPEDMPCVLVSNASRENQRVCWTRLSNLSDAERLPAPTLLIVGRVATQQAVEVANSVSLVGSHWSFANADEPKSERLAPHDERLN
jgi:uroporphyrin-III C-methyltransferase